MANKSVYQDYNQDALKHFGLENEPIYGILSSNGSVENTVITQHVTTFQKIHELLRNPTPVQSTLTNALSGYKKAFILPRSTVSLDRLKEACSEHNIKITNDYEKADFIISHGSISEKFESGNKIKTTTMLYKLWNYEAYDSSGGCIKSVDNNSYPVVYDDKWVDLDVRRWRLDDAISLYDEWAIPGLSVNLAYLIDTGELAVVNIEDFLLASSNSIELTEELVNDLTTWVESYDTENTAIAAKILPTIDYTKKKHLLWQLAQNIGHKLYRLYKDKDAAYWLKKSDFNTLASFNAELMIKHLEELNELDSESFKYLEPIVRANITIHNRALYVFKVSVKEEYKKYLK